MRHNVRRTLDRYVIFLSSRFRSWCGASSLSMLLAVLSHQDDGIASTPGRWHCLLTRTGTVFLDESSCIASSPGRILNNVECVCRL